MVKEIITKGLIFLKLLWENETGNGPCVNLEQLTNILGCKFLGKYQMVCARDIGMSG
jgi:hypothetical protein